VKHLNHYYTQTNDQLEHDLSQFKCFVAGREYTFQTDSGVFSKKGLDFGTRLLLEAIISEKEETVLDLGCGYGPIGIILQDQWQKDVTMVDINRRALEIARINAKLNKVKASIIESDGFASVSGIYSLIVTNPPIRSGKKTYYGWFDQARNHLSNDGKLVLVMRKDQGAKSAITYLTSLYASVTLVSRKAGYFIISCQNALTI
jgi:16S rRNA (guanine1207-N2)-methyltransferase